MGLYLAVARSAFRRFSTYRVATVTGVFVNSVFGLVRSFVLLAVWASTPMIGGYDRTDAVTYAWLAQALIMTTGIFGTGDTEELALRVRSGDIVIDLYRPVDLQGWWLASEYGRASFSFLARGIPPMIVGALLFDLRSPHGLLAWAGFVLAVVVGIAVGFAIRFIIALIGFWLVDSRGVLFLVNTAGMFFSGFLLPIGMFPPALAATCYALPWVAMVQTPVDVYLGQYPGWELAGRLGLSLGWALLLLGIGRLLLRSATRRLVVQGG